MFNSIKTGVLALILISVGIAAHAQKKITEGTVTYSTDASDTKIDFNGNLSNLKIQAGPAAISIIMDHSNKTGLVLVSVPIAQKQFASKMSPEDVDKQAATMPKFSDFVNTGEKKVIAGYNSEKYTFKDNNGNSGEVWTTTDIEIPLNSVSQSFKDIKGTVVKITSQGVSSTLKSIKEDKITLSVTEIPKGYELITYAELMAMQGGN